jgi:hypothetical protein
LTPIISGETYKLWSSSLCSLLQSPAIVFLMWETTFHTHRKLVIMPFSFQNAENCDMPNCSCHLFLSCMKCDLYLEMNLNYNFLKAQCSGKCLNLNEQFKIWLYNMDVYPFFLCCVVLCVGRGLASGWSPFQGVLPSVQ